MADISTAAKPIKTLGIALCNDSIFNDTPYFVSLTSDKHSTTRARFIEYCSFCKQMHGTSNTGKPVNF